MKLRNNWRVKGNGFLFLCGFAWFPAAFSADVEFNTDVLDIQDRENFDLTPFAKSGYIMPGDYLLTVKINGHSLVNEKIIYREVNNNDLPEAKLTPELVAQFALKPAYKKALIWSEDGGLVYSSLPGMSANVDLGSSVLNISVPQIYLEYISADWDPPARWDEGVGGALLDYNFNANTSKSNASGEQNSLTGSGTLGANLGAWRFRADWQLLNMLPDHDAARKGVDISRYYLYRAIPSLQAKFSAGENYLASDIFDSFRFMGASLESDVSMLPPSLRGYAPEVNGVADSNATVIISQQGRIIYQTQVPAGPFSIQDLNSAISGLLDVEIQEQDGQVKKYQVATASLPYLTRPGAVRYKLTAGRPAGWDHAIEGPMFTAGEVSWGITNGWSLYGGAIGSDGYQSLAAGIGRDLFMLGAISTDLTLSRQQLPGDEQSQGRSLRINYAKMFEEYDSQVTFAGYRFSEENFYSMSEYLGALRGDSYFRGNSKERYDLSFNKRFTETGITTYLTYSHQSYWNRPSTERVELTFSHYFELAGIKNISGNVRAYRQSYYGSHDDGLSFGVSIPWGKQGWLRYDSYLNRDRSSHSVGYSGRTASEDNYNLRTTVNRNDSDFSGFWSRQGNRGDISLSATHSTSSRNSASVGLNGGVTMTSAGVALHGSGSNGGTRLLLDTEGVAGVPVQGAGRGGVTNSQGLAVMNGVSSYNRTQASVALDKLGEDVEAINAVTQLTLTEGAIGYRKIEVVAGRKGLAVIRMADGKAPPFGAMVYTASGKNAGIVADDGQVWLSGMKTGETMQVRWDGQTQCEMTLPDLDSGAEISTLLLLCHRTEAKVTQQTTDLGRKK
ncbi:fimbria/pilus outer membrane usher protein [Pantoea sp. USHLN256]|uniref:fimbria/pilus outer membrane usher protein n=1 Tax=Pantoea sp. USHLN256 TaxID=3081293 RepID=UPI0030161FCD